MYYVLIDATKETCKQVLINNLKLVVITWYNTALMLYFKNQTSCPAIGFLVLEFC